MPYRHSKRPTDHRALRLSTAPLRQQRHEWRKLEAFNEPPPGASPASVAGRAVQTRRPGVAPCLNAVRELISRHNDHDSRAVVRSVDLGPPFRRCAIPGYYCYNNPNPNPVDPRNGGPLPAQLIDIYCPAAASTADSVSLR